MLKILQSTVRLLGEFDDKRVDGVKYAHDLLAMSYFKSPQYGALDEQ